MLLFRSEEHARNWSRFDTQSAEAVLPIADWVHILATGAFTKRLAMDYFDTYDEDFEDFFARLAEYGRSGPFWRNNEE
ncbi:MAG: hypothetical protein M3132_08240 [Actinomycetia bacterium]|nr:hypothetical protein [Actinomycetes bacterium]